MISVFNPIGWFEYINYGHKPQELDYNSFSFVYQKFDYKNYSIKDNYTRSIELWYKLTFFEMGKGIF